ncbi:MAG: 50S ribosomal protein L21 [Weeksellaceae bacterium]
MKKVGIIQVAGKQYMVSPGDEIIVDLLKDEKEAKIELPLLMTFDEESGAFNVGAPVLEAKATAEVVDHVKGDKLRISKFKSKVRYRKTVGFRPQLTKIKVLSI